MAEAEDFRDPATGVPEPRAMRAHDRMSADAYLLERWREDGYQAAAEEACRRHGHLRARGDLCDRCGRGLSRRSDDHLRREVDLAAARALSPDPRLSPPPRR